jgi:tRNA(Ile)-lysidine synthase
VEQLSQLADSARRYYIIVCSRADELWPSLADCNAEKTVLDLKLFLTETQSVKVELIRRSLANIACGERYVTQGHYESILQLAEQNVTGRKVELPGGYIVWREYGKLVFSNRRVCTAHHFQSWWAMPTLPMQAVTVEIPGQKRFGGYLIEASVLDADDSWRSEFGVPRSASLRTQRAALRTRIGGAESFDLDKIKPPLIVRYRRPGDKFVPLGQSKAKKLGKFLTAQRIPHGIRRDVLVVSDRKKIIWFWPVRISEQSKITSQTRKILQLRIEAGI